MSINQKHIIIGTSGHIDHGKSSIVKALTGTDPDRFQEEKDRGMTIDLGYAFYNENVAFIDVPGHEKFIKNMVAGVTTIDFVMLVIAADDGVMPQTREHLDILSVLGIKQGIVVINKIDTAEPDWLELVEEDIRDLVKTTFLKEAPIVKVSAVTLEGIEDLKKEIDLLKEQSSSRRDRGYFWLPIDRSFSIQGFGTVVTGSVISGELSVGEEVELCPKKQVLKVRGLQRHGNRSETVRMGDRAAVNLQGIHRAEIKRGDILVSKGYGLVTKRIDVQLQLLAGSPWPVKDQDRLRLHIGTNEIFIRVRLLDCKELLPGNSAFVQLILEEKIAVNRHDRFVVRKYSPSITIGGGLVLDNYPLERHKRFDANVLSHFKNLLDENPQTIILEYLQNSLRPKKLAEISQATSLQKETVIESLEVLQKSRKILTIQSGPNLFYFGKIQADQLNEKIVRVVREFHDKNAHLPGISRAELISRQSRKLDTVIYEALIDNLVSENKLLRKGDIISSKEFSSEISDQDQMFYEELKKHLKSFSYAPPVLKELYQNYSQQKKQLDILIPYGKSHNDFVVLGNGLVYLTTLLEELKKKVQRHISVHQFITVGDFRDMIQASRKYAVSVLEYFDEIGFTRREGDERVLN